MKKSKSKYADPQVHCSGSIQKENVLEIPEYKYEARARLAEIMFPRRLGLPYDSSGPDSYEARLDRLRNWFLFALDQNFEMMVTIQFNEKLNEGQLRAKLKRFDAFVNRYYLGREWAKFQAGERAFFLAFAEANISGSDVHTHLLLRRPQRKALFSLRTSLDHTLLAKQWTVACRKKHICPHGDIDIRAFDGDVALAHAYALKYIEARNLTKGFFLSSEFGPSEKVATRPSSGPYE